MGGGISCAHAMGSYLTLYMDSVCRSAGEA